MVKMIVTALFLIVSFSPLLAGAGERGGRHSDKGSRWQEQTRYPSRHFGREWEERHLRWDWNRDIRGGSIEDDHSELYRAVPRRGRDCRDYRSGGRPR